MCQNVSRLQIFQNKPSKTNKVTDVLSLRVPDRILSCGMNIIIQHIQIQNGIFSYMMATVILFLKTLIFIGGFFK